VNNSICLCGSTRFLKEYEEANRELSFRGFSVVTIAMVLPKEGSETYSPDDAATKELLDLVHLNKILMTDAIFVVGDGYVGKSTAKEILWADMQGRTVLSKPDGAGWNDVAIAVRLGMSDPAVVQSAFEALGLAHQVAQEVP
jgi:hypothetical protein